VQLRERSAGRPCGPASQPENTRFSNDRRPRDRHPKEHLAKVFDPIYDKQRGSGLGLAVTYSIINKHGGHITLEYARERNDFRFYLPATRKSFPARTEV
jgi:hypothetical protein